MAFVNLEAPYAALRVCVDRDGSGQLSGLVYSQRLTEPLPFADVGALLLRLDEVLDRQNFPQAFQQTRRFTPAVGAVPAAASPEEGLSAQLVCDARGSYRTFVICVTARRSATWQGWVDWLDGGPRQRFKSALELLRQMEERLGQA